MQLRSLKDDIKGVVDLGVVITIGIAFAALMVIILVIYTVKDNMLPYTRATLPTGQTAQWYSKYNMTLRQTENITAGFDDAINLILVAVTIFILAIAISALLMLRGR